LSKRWQESDLDELPLAGLRQLARKTDLAAITSR